MASSQLKRMGEEAEVTFAAELLKTNTPCSIANGRCANCGRPVGKSTHFPKDQRRKCWIIQRANFEAARKLVDV